MRREGLAHLLTQLGAETVQEVIVGRATSVGASPSALLAAERARQKADGRLYHARTTTPEGDTKFEMTISEPEYLALVRAGAAED